MGILRTAALTGLVGLGGGVAGVGAGMAYLLGVTAVVPLTKDDQAFKTRTWSRINPRSNPALKDDVIRVVPLSKLRPELRNDEKALTLEFCRGVWSRWAFHIHSLIQQRYDRPPGTDDNLWHTSELAVSKFNKGLRFSNHFEVVDNSGSEIVVRCGGSPMESGLRKSDGLIFLSAKIDPEQQLAIFHFKSALFSSGAPKGESTAHSLPPKVVKLHEWYCRMLSESAMANVKE
ncbi:hypothetical protein F5B22DRAFT_640988 [Xylaria bambusicola]|uniref:uncharacterized protein n=1 Tax=Xylaria bambusicola TaxID=326684 RepID=UPI0020076F46|nr:uncharacterized protein F5B22DRAFT_640988 [Xylaria bambusicola]KAI0528012.1 hypothetical protein F5B22DRAFT_640988 [Xylaria bambusicola]